MCPNLRFKSLALAFATILIAGNAWAQARKASCRFTSGTTVRVRTHRLSRPCPQSLPGARVGSPPRYPALSTVLIADLSGSSLRPFARLVARAPPA